jgi:tetratricopeptide (TPR) repeat protein
MADWPMVAWEIGAAGWASDHDRALKLFDHALADELAPRRDLQLLRARHLFFAVYLDSICDLLASEFGGALSLGNHGKRLSWQPFLGTDRSYQMNLFMGTIFLCRDVPKLRTNLTDAEKAHLRYAIADVENADAELEQEGHVFQLILPACLYSIGRYHEAADAYRRLLSKYAPETNRARIPVFRSIAACHESAGDLKMSDSTLAELLEVFPGEKGVRPDRIRLLMRQTDQHRALQMLKEEADLDSSVSEDPLASLALTLGEIVSEQSSGDFSSAIARGFLERNPAVSSLIDALHGEYWPTYRKLSEAARAEWRYGTTQSHYFSAIDPSQSLKARKDAIRNFAKSVELEIHDFFVAFREWLKQAGTTEPLAETRENAGNALQRKFVSEIRSARGGLMLSLGEMYELLALYRVPRSMLVAELAEFHSWLKLQCPAIFGVVRAIDDINRVRNLATHANVDPAEIERTVLNCRQVQDAIKGR